MPEQVTPPNHRRLLLILLPVAGLHALALATLLPWFKHADEGFSRSVAVELAPASPPAEAAPETQHWEESRSVTEPVAQVVAASQNPPARQVTRTAPSSTTAALPPRQAIEADERQADSAIESTPSPSIAARTADEPAPTPADTTWQQSYLQRLRSALERHKHYPAMARRFGEEGEAVLAFRIERDGRLSRAKLQQGSGSERLDQAALQALHRLARFEPLPPHYTGDSLPISVPLVYRLE